MSPVADLIEEIASDEMLDRAYQWMCERRKDYSANSDVWDVRWKWHDIKPRLRERLVEGGYRFSPLRRVQNRDHETLELWSALDALVLKSIAIVLTKRLSLSDRCYHLPGHGGAKAAVRDVVANLPDNPFVFRSDVKSYYASIDHDILLGQLAEHIDDSRLLDLVEQYVRRTVVENGLYEDVTKGISLGCALSPVMGALYLERLDERMEATGLFYARFMDDWVVLAPSRWKLRRAVQTVQQTLDELKVETHPDKTFIGRTERGFDFLGYQINAAGMLGAAPPTVTRFVARVIRLYEQGASSRCIGDYVRRWMIWVVSGLKTEFASCGVSILPITMSRVPFPIA